MSADDAVRSHPIDDDVEMEDDNDDRSVDLRPADSRSGGSDGKISFTSAELQQLLHDAAEVASMRTRDELTQLFSLNKGKSKAHARKPEMWDGVNRVPRIFLLEMENYFAAEEMAEDERVSQAITFFSPKMQDWYANYKGAVLSDADLAWDDFRQILLKGHPGQEPQHTVRPRLAKLQMVPGKVQEYMHSFLAMAHEATGKFALGEVEACGYIIRAASRSYPALASEIRFLRVNDSFVPWDDYKKLLEACIAFDTLPGGQKKAGNKPDAGAGSGSNGEGGWQVKKSKKRPFSFPNNPKQGAPKKLKGKIEVLPKYSGKLAEVPGLRELLTKDGICHFCRDHTNKHHINDCPRVPDRNDKPGPSNRKAKQD